MKNNYKKFLQIFNFSNKAKIVNEIDFLIKTDNIDTLSSYLKSNYELTKDQKIAIIKKWDCFVIKNRNHDSREDIKESLVKDKKFIQDLFIDVQEIFLKNAKKIFAKTDHDYPSTTRDEYRKYDYLIVEPMNIKLVLLNELNIFDDYEIIKKSINLSQQSKELISKYERYFNRGGFSQVEFLVRIQDKENDILEKLNKNFNNNFKEDLQKNLQETHLLYNNLTENVNNGLISRIEEKMSNLGPSVIPKMSWELFKNIENMLSQINMEKLSVSEKWETDNIIGKRLPEMLEDYLSISDSYKHKLKTTDGKSADDLLSDSLNEIHMFINEIFIQQQENSLLNLSAKNRYFKQK